MKVPSLKYSVFNKRMGYSNLVQKSASNEASFDNILSDRLLVEYLLAPGTCDTKRSGTSPTSFFFFFLPPDPTLPDTTIYLLSLPG
jgi:hypothetical protein